MVVHETSDRIVVPFQPYGIEFHFDPNGTKGRESKELCCLLHSFLYLSAGSTVLLCDGNGETHSGRVFGGDEVNLLVIADCRDTNRLCGATTNRHLFGDENKLFELNSIYLDHTIHRYTKWIIGSKKVRVVRYPVSNVVH